MDERGTTGEQGTPPPLPVALADWVDRDQAAYPLGVSLGALTDSEADRPGALSPRPDPVATRPRCARDVSRCALDEGTR